MNVGSGFLDLALDLKKLNCLCQSCVALLYLALSLQILRWVCRSCFGFLEMALVL